MRASIVFALIVCLFTSLALAKKKKKKGDEEEITQTLPVIKDPPAAITAETDRLVFRVAPLSGKGLLTAQVRDALKALIRDNRTATIVKLRAFVAGTGDMRRVPTIVSEVFSEKKLPLPVVTTLQAGALPLEGAQVAIESMAVERRAVNAHGLAFAAAMPVEQLKSSLAAAGIRGDRVVQASCFMSSLDTVGAFRAAVQAAFPAAVADFVQMQRVPVRQADACEVVAMMESGETSVDAKLARVHAPKVILTGAQLAFNAQDADVRLAFERLRKTLEAAGVSYKNVIAVNIYPLADDIADKARRIEPEFFNRDRPPTVSSIPMEGLPSHAASFAVEAMALP